MRYLAALLTTLILVMGGFFASHLLREKLTPNWDTNETYAIWIEGAEVSPDNPDGKQWHDDGTAPNLVATLTWRNNMLLETPESSNSLIAKWERTSIKIKDLMKTELAPNALEKVARVHAAPRGNPGSGGARQGIALGSMDRCCRSAMRQAQAWEKHPADQ